MPPKPMHLHRRRWTLLFSLPFTLVMLAICAYSVFLLIAADERLIRWIAGVSAFGSFCVGGTFGKAVWEALYNREPAVIVDAQGLTDVRGAGLLAWRDIESIKLDGSEEVILVKFAPHSARGRVSKTRRALQGADYVVALNGIRYSHAKLARALAEHLRQSKVAPTHATVRS